MAMKRAAFLLLALGCQASPQAVEPAPRSPSPTVLPVAAPEAPAELKELRKRIRELAARSLRLQREAHEALDQGRYDDAAALHQESLDVARAADTARGSEDGVVRAAARRLMIDLDGDEIGVREIATRELLDLGAPPGVLRSCAKDLSAEARKRLDMILRTLEERDSTRQWAVSAAASTEYGQANWSAKQATGAPNTAGAGDFSTAWASREPDGDTEWLLLGFDTAVEPTTVRIHETYNAGAISKVELRDGAGAWRTVWEGQAAPTTTPRWFEVAVTSEGWTTKEVRVTLDSDAAPGWNEIDAVELVGRRQ
jgi:hypothetical protein